MGALTDFQKDILLKFNNTVADFDWNKSLVDLFEVQCAKTPNDFAVEFGNEKLTYNLLNSKANKIAHWILASGILPESQIGICAERSFDLVAGILGILKAGCAYVPFDPAYPVERIQYMVRESAITTILIQDDFNSIFDSAGVKTKAIDKDWNDFAKLSDVNLKVKSKLTSLAYVLFTSGSTGMPKGVAMVQEALVNLVNWQNNNTPLATPARTLQFAPISFDVSFQELFTTWTTGGTLVLISDEMRLNAIRLLEFINNNKIERLFLPFIALQHLSEVAVNSKVYPTCLKDIITAGEQLQITRYISEFFEKMPGCKLHNHYGPTETHVVTSYILDGPPSSWVPLPPIGKPVSNSQIYILGDDMLPVNHGDTGEIYVAGKCLAKGYINRPELTAERFIKNPFNNQKGSVIYKTGDLGKYLPDGNIEYEGRADNQVKVRGYRIELGEVEVMLGKMPGLNQVAVTMREDEPGNKRLVAYLVTDTKKTISAAQVRKFLAGKLPEYMLPSAFVFIPQMPKTPSGKIDRKALPAPDHSRPDIGTLFVEPKSGDEKIIAQFWSSLLQIDKVGVRDNFFDLGGNSLLALQFIAKMQQQHGRDIPVVKLYQHPSIESLLNSLAPDQDEKSIYEKAQLRAAKSGSLQNESKSVEDGIAIIGMSGRFPGAQNVDELWENLKKGKETTSFFSDSEMDKFIDPSLRNDSSYVKARGIISDVDKFDASFFQVNPRLAELMDPQQRVFLEVCWESLESAGYSPSGFPGLIGVFAGMGNNTYYQNNVWSHKDAIEKVGSFQVMVANEKDYIATRVSHIMNLKGPGLSVHTACSTSLTAVAMACQALWSNQCDMAIAGGVAITSPVNSGHLYQEGGMFSSDGHTRSFDHNATGTVFSDGAGVVTLKRYRDAVADGDSIYGVIRGVGINNDGSEKASFTAPSVAGQAQAIAMAQADAGITPGTVTYIETHGTATPLGDPIEIEALTQAFHHGENGKQYCAIGSIKSNFGHLTAAAGVAGLIKTALALTHKVIPPSINYEKPNPAIDFTNSPFYVNDKLVEWKVTNFPRRAGVSSFGVGGTNVHLVVEEAPVQPDSGPHRPKHLVLISTKGNENLSRAITQLENYFEHHKEINIADAAYTLQTGRVHFPERKYFVCDDASDFLKQTTDSKPERSGGRNLQVAADGVAFMFPGQGSQYVNMGKNLYRDEIIFKQAVDQCAEKLSRHMDVDIRDILYPSQKNIDKASTQLQDTCYTQPALFTIGYALSRLWMSWGIKPSALIGHSIGEFVAACISGIMSLDDALMLVANRGKMMQALPAGSMLSVRMSATELEKIITPDLAIAAINGQALSVVSGNTPAIEKLQAVLESKEIISKKLFTSHAFHSPMMEPIMEPFKKLVAGVHLNPPSIPVVSTATAEWLTVEQATNPDYWAQHLRLPVRFAEGIQTLWKENPTLFLLEMGPRNTASTLAKQQSKDSRNQFAIPSLPDNSENDAEWVSMLNAVGRLWLAGINIDWKSFYALEKRNHVALPTYPFERKRFWVEPTVPSSQVNTFHPYVPFPIQSNIEHDSHKVISPGEINTTIMMNNPNRKDRIISELRNLMEDASGIELSSADSNSSFMELGLDSLFLTQAALTLSKKYGTKITFRQLNETFSTLELLAKQIDSNLPAEQVSAAAVPPVHQNLQASSVSVPMPGNETPGTLQWLITQQLQVMQQQLAMVNGMQLPSVSIPPPAPAPEIIHKATPSEISENEQAELSKPFGAIARIEKAVSSELSAEQKKWLLEFRERYNKKTIKSKNYTQEHRSHLADPRVVTGFKPTLKELIYQVVVERSEGCRVWDIDGNEYIDVLNGFGSNFLGYGSEIVMKAVHDQLQKGIELGPQHPLAGEVARLICEFTGYDRAGFCNTGSEAVLGALRIARTVTGRSTIVCFNGSYHGINDEVIVRGTKKLKSFPAAAGIMPESVHNMLVLDYGTEEALEIIKSRADEIAAVMIEPIQSRRADFRPKEFIEAVRKITTESGALLIFDEVITGFRLLPGGAQEFYNVKADLGTYGKVIGGGMPIGVIAGKKEYMDALDGGFWQFGDNSVPEAGVTYFAGTFVRHPLALAAAKAVLLHLKQRGMSIYQKLNGYTDKLVNSVNEFAGKVHAPFHLVSFGSLFKLKWDVEHPYDELIFLLLRHKGIHIYDGFPCFFTDAFTDADVDRVISTFIESIKELQAAGFLISGQALNGTTVIIESSAKTKIDSPPVPGAKPGKDKDGNPGWFIADPDRPGKFKQVFHS